MPDNSSFPAIQFHFLKQSSFPKQRKKLKSFIINVFKKERAALNSLTYIFCSDEYLLGINQEFLQHDYYTDIISFNLAGKNQPVEGEIYISLDRVRDNAKGLEVSFNAELHRVIFHGALHLCGYKDKKAQDIGLMRKMEDLYLTRYFK